MTRKIVVAMAPVSHHVETSPQGPVSPEEVAAGFCLGVQWGLPADPKSLYFLTSLLPADIHWGIVHAGMQDFSLLATAVGMGASMVRVGFEDSPCYAPGKTAATNAQLVEKIVSLVRMLGCEAAGPEDARAILGLQKKEKPPWPKGK